MPTETCPCGCVQRNGASYTWLISPPLPVASASKHWASCYPESHYIALEEANEG